MVQNLKDGFDHIAAFLLAFFYARSLFWKRVKMWGSVDVIILSSLPCTPSCDTHPFTHSLWRATIIDFMASDVSGDSYGRNAHEKDHKRFISRGEVSFPVCCNSFFPLRKHFWIQDLCLKSRQLRELKCTMEKPFVFLNHAINYEKQIIFPKYDDTIISE